MSGPGAAELAETGDIDAVDADGEGAWLGDPR
jgi:hypothetical protein